MERITDHDNHTTTTLVDRYNALTKDTEDMEDSMYNKKAMLLNAAMLEVGFGRYQWYVQSFSSLHSV